MDIDSIIVTHSQSFNYIVCNLLAQSLPMITFEVDITPI